MSIHALELPAARLLDLTLRISTETFPRGVIFQGYLTKRSVAPVCPNALTRFKEERKESASAGVWCRGALAEGAL